MVFTASVLLALLPILISAQPAPLNETIFGGYPSDVNALLYYRASHSTNMTNSVNFPGFNWSAVIGSSVSAGNTNSSDTWQMHLNYSRLAVPTNNGNATIGLTVLSMTFPDEEWALDSDWSLCASLLHDLPDSVAPKSRNDSDASCVPYLGQSCVDAFMKAYQSQSVPLTGTGCPSIPSLSNIDECKSVASGFAGSGTSVISTNVSPDLLYESNHYVNISGGAETYTSSNVTRQGLSSGQAFTSFLSVFPNTNIDGESLVESKKLRLVGLSIVPSLDYRRNSTGGYGWSPNTRLICARPNASSGGSLKFGSISGGMLLMGVAVASLVSLW